ncbi:hypothetical protein AQJ11_10915 [Streptomyces corchorusii]|uniref:Uncharacterized protein n=2 Tax=Streptomyces TaxID=1883 RepID=A0A117QIU3_STRCK|nr:hypothetical protein [Streptomyces corchorusii]KUN30718.1 hypothetical protein AQJ11_10915 [Streptomyces corchorusii]
MTPIPAHSGAERESAPERTPGVRRGRHRKPRPRKVLLAAGGLALAAGVLSLVRAAPDAGVGAPGTAEAEPRLGAGGGSADRSADAAATIAAAPTALPSATSAMGGRSLAPTRTGSPVRTAAPGPGTATTASGGTAVPTARTSRTPGPPSATSRPPAPTASAPRPAPATSTPTPSPSHGPAEPEPRPGGVCVPVIGLCVDVLGDSPRRPAATAGRRGG